MRYSGLILVATLLTVGVGLNRAGVFPPAAEAAVPSSSVRDAVAGAALGAAKFSVNLTWDGGATGTSQVKCFTNTAGGTSINQTIQFQAVASPAMPTGTAFCYKTCTSSTCVPDCSKDVVLNKTLSTFQVADAGQTGYTFVAPGLAYNGILGLSEPIPMGNDTCVVVSAVDAGNPNVNLYTVTSNPPR